MKVLFVTPQLPWPATQGTALRNFQLLKAVAGRHEVHLLSFDPAAAAGAEVPAPLAALCRRVDAVPAPPRPPLHRLRDLAMGHADMERRLWSPRFAATLRQRLRETRFDVVQLEAFEVAGYLLGPGALWAEAHGRAPWDGTGAAPHTAPQLVFDDHNAEYELQASASRIDAGVPARWLRAGYSALQARRLRRREALYCAAADACLAVSAEDAAALEDLVPHLGARVVPNGVDVASFAPPQPAAEPVIFFSGKLDYRPNADACEWLVRQIMPRVWAAAPEAHLVLAGRDPLPAVRALADKRVEVTGWLDEDALARRRGAAWVYAVPMRMGSGVRFKVLEAMAAGIPLVATPLGAAGSGAVHSRHALIAADASAFAEAVVALLRDPSRRAALAGEARRLAEQRHDWSRITPLLLECYERLHRPPVRPVSLITTLLNEKASVPSLVDSIGAQSRQPDEVVVADGGSSDGTPSLVAARAARHGLALQALDVPGANIAAGRNAAVRRAAHATIAATDAGVALHPAWLARLTAPFERDAAPDAVSGFFVSAPRSTWEQALGATTLPAVEEVDPARFLPSSRSVAFTRRAWERAGGYPEWLDFCEDLVFDVALLAGGARPRFVPRAVARFRPRSSPRSFFWQYYRYARGDGKADLWRRRHAIRYGTYAAALALSWWGARGRRGGKWAWLALMAGGVTYIRRPLLRLWQQSPSRGVFLCAAPLVPLVRLIGDVAKMAGYPVGVRWRLQHRR